MVKVWFEASSTFRDPVGLIVPLEPADTVMLRVVTSAPAVVNLATKASAPPVYALKGVPQVATLSPPTYIFPLPSKEMLRA